jgi:hypothetical protein
MLRVRTTFAENNGRMAQFIYLRIFVSQEFHVTIILLTNFSDIENGKDFNGTNPSGIRRIERIKETESKLTLVVSLCRKVLEAKSKKKHDN